MSENQNPFNIINPASAKVYKDNNPEASATDRIKKMIASKDVFLFMKGTPEYPQCGFSANTISILETIGANYMSFDVLSDPMIRQGIKDFANWPTIPQLYIRGEFIGGNDIVTEMMQSGDLQKMINSK